MILLGIDEAINTHESFIRVNIRDLDYVDDTSLVIAKFKREDLSFYNKEHLLAVEVNALEDFILLINTNAKYAICSKELAPTLQKCADAYLTDIKVVVMIDSIEELKWVAQKEIDGAISFHHLA